MFLSTFLEALQLPHPAKIVSRWPATDTAELLASCAELGVESLMYLRASYGGPYRQMLPKLLAGLVFRSVEHHAPGRCSMPSICWPAT